MTTLTQPQTSTIKHNYDVLIEQKTENKVIATLLGWQDFQAEGTTKEEALNNLNQMLNKKLEKTEIVSLEIEVSAPEHPWKKFAQMFKDDPDIEELQAFIEEDRRQLDAQMNEYYCQLDAQEK